MEETGILLASDIVVYNFYKYYFIKEIEEKNLCSQYLNYKKHFDSIHAMKVYLSHKNGII